MNTAALVTYAFISCFTPGPSNILCLTYAGRYGVRRTVSFIAGLTVGFAVLMAACGAASSAIFNVLPAAEPVMRWAGAVYLLWLAWHITRGSGESGSTETGGRNDMLYGVAVQLINPKCILYGITVWASFILPYYSGTGALILFTFLLTVFCPAASALWAFMGNALQRLMKEHGRLLNLIMALMLIGCAVSMVTA